MQVKDLMTPEVQTVKPDSPIQAAAQMMEKLDVGSIPVCSGDTLTGMITDRDITVRATAKGKDPATTIVQDVMTPGAVYCRVDQDVNDAAELMKRHRIRRLPVLNQDKRLVGILALADLAVDMPEKRVVEQVAETVSEPARPRS